MIHAPCTNTGKQMKDIRNNLSKFKNPFCKIKMGQKTISHIGPSVWNSLPNSIKKAVSLK